MFNNIYILSIWHSHKAIVPLQAVTCPPLRVKCLFAEGGTYGVRGLGPLAADRGWSEYL